MNLVDVFEEFRFVTDFFCGLLVFTLMFDERRKNFRLRLSLCYFFMLGVSLIYLPVRDNISNEANIIFAPFWYAFIVMLLIISFAICFRITYSELIFKSLGAYAFQHIKYVLIHEILSIGLVNKFRSVTWWFLLYFVISIGFLAGLYYLVYVIFKKELENIGKSLYEKKGTSFFFTFFLIVLFSSSFMFQHLFYNGDNDGVNGYSYLSASLDFGVNVLILFTIYMVFSYAHTNQEKEIAERLLHNSQKEFEMSKENVDLINRKAHDLKRQMEALRLMSDDEKKESIKVIMDAVNIYDSKVKTSNDVLDTVLNEKSIYCRNHGISLTCLVDDRDIKNLSTLEIYTLFSNLLDNAIEATCNIKDKDKRVISLKVNKVANFISISTNNYFEGKVIFKEGMPQTSKQDKRYHGYGVKSISYIVNQHKGSLKFKIEDDIFIAQILLPILTE